MGFWQDLHPRYLTYTLPEVWHGSPENQNPGSLEIPNLEIIIFRFQPLNFGGVDTKNDGYLIASSFKYGYFNAILGIHVSFRGGKTSESEWNRKKQNFSKRDIQYIIETQRLIKNNLPTQH